tara:strand:- start:881 stop:1045 length:165 start_codon:yes stop_codon:yes gene_type:complete
MLRIVNHHLKVNRMMLLMKKLSNKPKLILKLKKQFKKLTFKKRMNSSEQISLRE